MVKKIWLTYAWKDNANQDVDFIKQELEKAGVIVLLDRWEIAAGKSLWQSIEAGICDPNRSDAWAIYCSEDAFRRPAVREELDWALNRALQFRSVNYPLIGIFPGPISESAIPAPLRVRRYVTLAEPDWSHTVVSAANGVPPDAPSTDIRPTYWKWHELEDRIVLELRPRVGIWNNFFVAVPGIDKNKLLWVSFGAPNSPFRSASMESSSEAYLLNGERWEALSFPTKQPNPTQSVYIDFSSKPVAIFAAVPGREGPAAKFVLQSTGAEQAY